MPSRPRFGEASSLFPPVPDISQTHSFSARSKIRRHHPVLVAGLVAGGSVAAAIAFLLFLLLLYRKLRTARTQKTRPFEFPDSVNLQKFTYRDLKAATRSFDDAQKLGQGGFGAVYKGQLPHNGQQIAVKVLDGTSLQGEREFQNEVSVIGKVASPHIVGLLGFCADRKRGRRLLVYEFMQNRSLQDALFDEGYPVQLDWGDRFKIIVDTAKALAFLHSKCDPPIIHGDVKPSNILLDGSFSARLADFGLARFKKDVSGEDLEAQGRAEKGRKYRKKERRNHKSIKEEESVINIDGAKNDEDPKVITDGDPGGVVNIQSPETFVSNSPTDENAIFLSSNGASPEGLHYETDTVTETVDERTPSEIVDLDRCNNAAETSKAKDRTVDAKSVDFSRVDEEDKTSISDCCFDKASMDSGRHGNNSGCVYPGRRKKGSMGRDRWWRQDSSGDSSVKDYVMEWIGTEIKKERPKSSWRTDDDDAAGSERGSNFGSARKTDKKKQRRKESLEWWTALAEEGKEIKKKEKSKSIREGREWWREEYCEELSNKSSSRKNKSKSVGEWWKNDMEEEIEAKKKRRGQSIGGSRDWWFGEEQHRRHHCGGDWGSGVSSTPSTRGTVCYVAPEYGGGGLLSEKSDVYSFGVVMLVVISGRRPLQVMASPITELERANLLSWARHLARSGNVLELVDVALGADLDRDQAVLCITVALLCLQRSPAARPSMSEVVKFLTGEVEAPPLPVEFSPSPPYGIPFRSRRKTRNYSRRQPPL
uniref:TSA: Wollemia nobilis Ref_Wollemi_Transcript_10740_3037 transcribed RNA sequence n=1 Tax=Wollemia nobilis TaxID=56998 RepID=A0A0C9QTB8_9CONI